MPRRLPILMLGIAIGAGLMLALAAWLWPAPAPTPPTPQAPTLGEATLYLFVLDDTTGMPLTATINLRRETPDGTPVPPADGETYVAQNISVTVPIDGNVVWLLMEAPGYQDWQLTFRLKKVGSIFGGPVRLKRLDAPDGPGA